MLSILESLSEKSYTPVESGKKTFNLLDSFFGDRLNSIVG